MTKECLALLLGSGYRDPADREVRYGFGVSVHTPSRSIGHGGLWSGYGTHVAHFLNTGLTVALHTNRDGRVDLESIVVRIAWLATRG